MVFIAGPQGLLRILARLCGIWADMQPSLFMAFRLSIRLAALKGANLS